MFRHFITLVIHHLANFDALIQRELWFIQKVMIDNLCKRFNEIYSQIYLKMLGEREKPQKIEDLNNKKSILAEIKTIFSNFLKVFFQKNIKIADTSSNIQKLTASKNMI